MSYAIVVNEGALARLVGLPDAVLDAVEAALERLAGDPLRWGRKAVFPYPPSGQIYPFHCDYDETRYYFVVFYFFGQDEKTLMVHDVTVAT